MRFSRTVNSRKRLKDTDLLRIISKYRALIQGNFHPLYCALKDLALSRARTRLCVFVLSYHWLVVKLWIFGSPLWSTYLAALVPYVMTSSQILSRPAPPTQSISTLYFTSCPFLRRVKAVYGPSLLLWAPNLLTKCSKNICWKKDIFITASSWTISLDFL